MALLFTLMFEFFKIGLFAVGGGQATIPFLYDLCNKYPWFTPSQLADMIAISESTPGPIGINMATYAGFNASGIVGGVLATLALVCPSIIVIILISKALDAFRDNVYVKNVFAIIRPCVVGLIASSALTVFMLAVVDESMLASGNIIGSIKVFEMLLFVFLFILTNKTNKHPILYLAIAMVIGIVLQL